MTKAKITAGDILRAIRRKHAADAVVREVVIDDPFEEGYRFRERIDRYAAQSVSSEDHHAHWVRREIERAAVRGIEIPDALPEGWTLRTSVPRRRIDALILASTGRTAIEIKVSRADFRRETEEKRRAWRTIVNRFIYAAPVGLIPRDELPAGCGLWEFDPEQVGRYGYQHGLTAVARAKVNKSPAPLPQQIVTALAYRVSNYERKETE